MLPPRPEAESTHTRRNQRSRPKRRALFCPAHPDQRIEGNGKKYSLHLLSHEELQQRGMNSKQAPLVINAYPVLVLSNATSGWKSCFAPIAAPAVGATSPNMTGSTTACAGRQGIFGSRWPMWIPQPPTPRWGNSPGVQPGATNSNGLTDATFTTEPAQRVTQPLMRRCRKRDTNRRNAARQFQLV